MKDSASASLLSPAKSAGLPAPLLGLQEARRLASSIIEAQLSRFKHPEGFLVGYGDAVSGARQSNHPIFEDLGDYMPFLTYFGYDEEARRQFRLALKALDRFGFYRDPRSPKSRYLIEAYGMTDMVFGMLEYWRSTGERAALESASKTVRNWSRHFFFQGWPSWGVLRWGKWPLPLGSTRHSGMYGELCVELSRETGRAEYLEIAEALLRKWASAPYFQTHGLFPDIQFPSKLMESLPWPRRIRQRKEAFTLFKENTNLVFSYLAFWEKTGQDWARQVWERWLDSACRLLIRPDGGCYAQWNPRTGPSFLHAFDFQVIELFLEAYRLTGNADYAGKARTIADFWLALQNPETGLFPEFVDEDRRPSRADNIDLQTDMAVSFLKLSRRTGEEKYSGAALRCYEGIVRHHLRPFGLCLTVDCATGEVLNTLTKTKFNFLFLKLPIALSRYGEIDEEPLFSLLKDR